MTFIAESETVSEWSHNPTSFDAWGRPKTVTDRSLFHATWTYDLVRDHWKIDEGAGWLVCNQTPVNVTSTNGHLVVNAGNTLTDKSIFQSRRSPKYQANRGHLYSTALGCPTPTSLGVRKWGLFNDEEGVYFKLKSDGKIYACIVRNSIEVKEEEITLPAGFDIAKGNLYDIQFQWRGVGAYSFMVSNPTTKGLEKVHTINHVNTLTEELSIRNPALPVRFESENLGDNVKIWAGCVDVTSEGGTRSNRLYGSVSTSSVTGDVLTGPEQPVMALRVNTTFNGLINTRDAVLKRIITSCNDESLVTVYFGCDPAIFTGTTWSDYKGVRENMQFAESTDLNVDLSNVNLHQIIRSRTEQDLKNELNNPSPELDFYLTNGDYLLVTIDPAGTSKRGWVTIEFVEEV